jgi:hypothetical protein
MVIVLVSGFRCTTRGCLSAKLSRNHAKKGSHLEGGKVPLSTGIVPNLFPGGLESHPCHITLRCPPHRTPVLFTSYSGAVHIALR